MSTITLSASPAYPAVLNPTTLTFNTSTATLDLTNNELITTDTPASIRTKIIAGQIFTSTPNGVLGYAEIGNNHTAVRYTIAGDVNLDGSVNIDDLGQLATNCGTTTGGSWSTGDFNFDNAVHVSDLGVLATHCGHSLDNATAPAATPAATQSAVPEPAMLAALASIVLRGRRPQGLGRIRRMLSSPTPGSEVLRRYSGGTPTTRMLLRARKRPGSSEYLRTRRGGRRKMTALYSPTAFP
ncbi:MAG TPA: hypothetical protein VLI90_14995 [Tepidisphaeraceae bacterium]|nr:hypothetical protein [Tepidisphaeraceae bacterium]